MRSTRTRKRPSPTWTSFWPTRPPARWPRPSGRQARPTGAVALIVAAGRGERLGAERPKALVELAGRPLVQWSVDALRDVDGMRRIVVALSPCAAPAEGVVAVQ